MKKRLLICAFISLCSSRMYATYPVPNFSPANARMMQVGGGSMNVVDPSTGDTVNWSWNGSAYVGTFVKPAPGGGGATPPPGRKVTRDQMVAAVNADPAGAAAAAQSALDALGIATTGPVSQAVAEYITG